MSFGCQASPEHAIGELISASEPLAVVGEGRNKEGKEKGWEEEGGKGGEEGKTGKGESCA